MNGSKSSKSVVVELEEKPNSDEASPNLKIVKRNGKKTDFSLYEISNLLKHYFEDIGQQVKLEPILRDVRSSIFDGITAQEVNKVVVMAIRARIEQDPIYSKLAARLLHHGLYKDVLGLEEFDAGFENKYREMFAVKIKESVIAEQLDKRLLDYDFEVLAMAMEPRRDQIFAYLGAQMLYDRYYRRDYEQNILEVPQYFWMRVAMGLALNEKPEVRADKAIEFYDVMSQLMYVPSTPTLFHSGTTHSQMSSCYLNTIEDDLTHIFKVVSDNAQLSKWSGGIGTDVTDIRGTGALIKSTNVPSQGVVPFLKILDSTTAAINRSGKRRGAVAIYMECWHYDYEDFLDLRKNTGDDRRRTHEMNTASWIPDLFMKRVRADGEWTLFSSDETPELHHIYGQEFEQKYLEYEEKASAGEMTLVKTIPAKNLWRKMISMLFETGHPWITFKDPSNIRSPQDHVGVVHNSNLCTEITLNTSNDETAVCNLGSVQLKRHLNEDKTGLDEQKVAKTVATAMRMLDNVVDLNFYPTPEAANSNMSHRPVGLGVMGYQDMLFEMGLAFDTPDAVEVSDRMMEMISYYAILNSSKLAKEKGRYKSYKGSKWDRGIFPVDTLDLLEQERGMELKVDRKATMDWEKVRKHVAKHGMRNSNTMAIAPTATISNVSGSLPAIEPIYKNIYVKSNISGEFTVINEYMVDDLKQLDMWNPVMLDKLKYYDGSIAAISEIPDEIQEKYKESFEIEPEWFISHAAVRGKWIDQSQSVNIFTRTQSGKKISEVYQYAWEAGLKTTYYLRTLGASAIEKSTIDINKQFDSAPEPVDSVTIEVSEQEIVDAIEHTVTNTEEITVTYSTSSELDGKLCVIGDPDCEACQ